METLIGVLKFIFKVLGDAISLAPTNFLIFLGAIFLILIIIFRKKLRKIPILLFIIAFALLASHLPGFIIQYEQSFAGTAEGVEWSIDHLNEQQVREEINSERQIGALISLQKKIEEDVLLFREASGVEKYGLFITRFKKRVYERTMQHKEYVLVLDSSGWLALLIGGLIGWLIWKIISAPFKALFFRKKGGRR